MTEIQEKPGWLTVLRERRKSFSPHAPRIRWKTWLLVTLVLATTCMYALDVALMHKARDLPDWFRSLALWSTEFGNSGWILTLAGVVFFLSLWRLKGDQAGEVLGRAHYWAVASAYVFLSVALSGILGNLMKRIIGRGRPRVFDENGAFHFQHLAGTSAFEGFPSGHSVTDGAIMMSLAVLFPAFRIPLLVAGFVLAMTRVWVGAHYPSDVIAGYSFGMWYAYMSAIFFAMHGFSLKPSDYVTR